MTDRQDKGGDTRGNRLAEWRAGWRTSLACMIGMGLGGSVTMTVFSLFILPLQDAFGWSRAEIATMFAAGFVTAFLGPLAGGVVDRIGVRRPLLAGLGAITLCYVGLSMMNGSLAVFYLLTCLLQWTGLVTTGLAYAKAVSQHFDKGRGLALAVSRSGMAIGNALLPILLYFIINEAGWRAGYLTMAGLITALALTTAWLWVRDPPEASGLFGSGRVAKRDFGWRRILCDRRLILLCIISVLGYAPGIALQAQLQPMLVDRGEAGSYAATLLGVLGVASFAGTLLTGALIDRLDPAFVGSAFALLAGLGSTLLLVDIPAPALLVLAVGLIGLCLGAQSGLIAFLVARIFGHGSFSSIYGIITCVMAMAVAGWSMMIGYTYQFLGSYTLFLNVLTAAFVGTALIYVVLARFSRQAAMA